jgi:hypothetical protein
MRQTHTKIREEARRLFLTAELTSNVEIAARLKVKPHTISRWRKKEDWDGLRLKVDRRAAEMFVEKLASDKTTLNITHYRLWSLLLTRLTESIKNHDHLDIKEMNRIATILERAQKGQRLAKGFSVSGEAEETIRAQSQAEIQRLIDTFIDSVKENVNDEETRDRIRCSILEALPEEEDQGVCDAGNPGAN